MADNFLSEDELILHRMREFHKERVQLLNTKYAKRQAGEDIGLLVAHLIPRACVLKRQAFDLAELKKQTDKFAALGGDRGFAVFNIEGILYTELREEPRSSSLLFRDSRLEGVNLGVGNQLDNGPAVARTVQLEQGVIRFVQEYLEFHQNIGETDDSVWLFSTLVGCKGMRLGKDWRFSDKVIDRDEAVFPEFEFGTKGSSTDTLLRQWCDCLWQAVGFEKSPHYNDEGKRQIQR